LNIPPASLKPWKTHCQTVAANGADLTMLVSRLRFDPAATGPVLTFESISWVSPEQAVLIERTLADEKKLEALVGRDDVAKQFGAAAHVPQQAPPAQIAPQPAPVVQQAPPPYQPPHTPQFMTPANQAAAPAEEAKPKRAPRAAKAPAPASPPPQQFMSPPTTGFMAPATMPQQGGVMPPVPSFLQRGPAPQVAPPPMATNFGMVQQPPATDSALDAAISLALNLGT